MQDFQRFPFAFVPCLAGLSAMVANPAKLPCHRPFTEQGRGGGKHIEPLLPFGLVDLVQPDLHDPSQLEAFGNVEGFGFLDTEIQGSVANVAVTEQHLRRSQIARVFVDMA